MTDQPQSPAPGSDPAADAGRECDDTPKLTADEWAYIQAVTDAEQHPEGGGD